MAKYALLFSESFPTGWRMDYSVPSPHQVAVAIVAYSLCSSSMLLVNKLVLSFIPLPSLVTFAQLYVTATFISILKITGVSKVSALRCPCPAPL